MFTVRAIFVWVAANIRPEPGLGDHSLSTVDILRYRAGTNREFVKIFTELCQAAKLKVKIITGFLKDNDHNLGTSNTSTSFK